MTPKNSSPSAEPPDQVPPRKPPGSEIARKGRPRFLSTEERAAVCSEFADGRTTRKALGEKFGVTGVTIAKIILEGVERTQALMPPAPAAEPTKFARTAVRIPRTSARSAQGVFAKLLYRVDANATSGFGFEGSFLKPGRTIDESELWPTARYPRIPILLEYAGMRTVRGLGRDADYREGLWILWRYEGRAWLDIARAYSASWQWAIELRPIASRLLAEANGHAGVEVLPSLDAAARRIERFLAREFAPLEARDRARLAGVLHDQFAAQMVTDQIGLD